METKAVGKSISFRPASLYDDAVAYGESLKEKLNPSEVICRALVALFESEGFSSAQDEVSAKRAELIAASQEVGIDAALLAVRSLRRTRNATKRRAA